MSRLRGSEVIVEHLRNEQVRYLFTLCGHGNVGLLDTLLDHRRDIEVISVHHEAAAGFMADAYYRVSRQPAVTLTSSGPGSANLIISLAAALMDSSSFLAITGNVPTSQFGRGPFQETGRYFQADFPTVVRSYVKRAFQATRVEQLPFMLRQSFTTMLTGRPGPVNLDVPLDVFQESADVDVPGPRQWRQGVTGGQAAADDDVKRVFTELAAAERPVLVVGRGVEVAGATAELLAVARRMRVPVACTPSAKGCIDSREELFVGATGRDGTHPANQTTSDADLILAVGVRFDDRSTSSWIPGYTFSIPPSRLIQVDIDPPEIARNYPVLLGIVADAKNFLAQLAAEAERNPQVLDRGIRKQAGWRDKTRDLRHEWEKSRKVRTASDVMPIRAERLLHEIRSVFPEGGTLVSDVGIHHNWIVQEWDAYQPGRLLQSWGFAAMGFGMAGVLGAKLAAPEQPAVAVVGDGGFLMMPSVVATAVEYAIPAVWIVWNNGGYVSIRGIQRQFFGPDREFVTSFLHKDGSAYVADCAGIARAMGAQAVVVDRPESIAEAVAAALDANAPFVVDVMVDRDHSPIANGTWDLPPLPHPAPHMPGSVAEPSLRPGPAENGQETGEQ